MIIGAHTSISGGLHLALERGHKLGCQTIQIFTKSSNQWKAKIIADADKELFLETSKSTGISPVIVHDSYLINLASPDPVIHEKSVNSFREEIERAQLLGIPFLVFHPGAHKGSGDEAGIKKIAESLNTILSGFKKCKVNILLETTAGQGTCIGHRFEHLRDIISRVNKKSLMGVCLDTCHIFQAGYDLRDKKSYEKTIDLFDKAIGLDRLMAFHLNDSKKPLGDRIDRHEHIGKGHLGLEPFRFLLNDPRFKEVPMVIETPKTRDSDEDAKNLDTLRRLIAT